MVIKLSSGRRAEGSTAAVRSLVAWTVHGDANSEVLTFADVLLFVVAIMTVDVAITYEQAADALWEITMTTHLSSRAFISYKYASRSTQQDVMSTCFTAHYTGIK